MHARGAGDAGCRLKFIETFGRRAFRRPLEPEEIARYDALFKAEGDFLKGAQTVIEAMLQSPSFLFWMEQTPNPKWKPYATACRLSYFLWDTMPDDALLDAASRGELNTVRRCRRGWRAACSTIPGPSRGWTISCRNGCDSIAR